MFVAATTNGSTTMRRHVLKKPFRSLVDQKPEASMPPKLIVVGGQTGLFMSHIKTPKLHQKQNIIRELSCWAK